MTEWFENPDFWEKMERFMFHFIRTPEDTRRETDGFLQLLGLKGGEKILDLGCGPGRHSLAFARLGYDVTSVDITPFYLEKLGRRAREGNLTVHIVKEDIRRFRKKAFFDAAGCFFSTFGYFSNPKHDRQVLRNVVESLKPGGRFLIDVLGREILMRNFREKNTFHDEETGAYLIEHVTINRRLDWVSNKWTLISGNRQKTYTFGLRIYSKEELEKALEESGYSKAVLYGEFDGAPYDHHARRLIVVATK